MRPFPDVIEGFDPDAPAEGGEGLFGLPHGPEEAAVHVLGVPFEATTSFGRGTAGGPAAVRRASHQVDLHDLDYPDTWKHGLYMAPLDPEVIHWNRAACEAAKPVVAAGGPGDDPRLQRAAARVDDYGAKVNAFVGEHVARILDDGRIPAVLGGDHSVPFGAIAAAAALHPGLGILHIDAHADLREAYEGFTWSHASILHNVLTRIEGVGPVVQVGLRDVGRAEMALAEADPRVHVHDDHHIARSLAEGVHWATLCDEFLEPLPEHVWVTFDIDGLEPALCPGTGTPVPGGLTWREAVHLLRTLPSTERRIVGFDLCEVGQEPFDANVGARLLYKLAGCALQSQR